MQKFDHTSDQIFTSTCTKSYVTNEDCCIVIKMLVAVSLVLIYGHARLTSKKLGEYRSRVTMVFSISTQYSRRLRSPMSEPTGDRLEVLIE